MDDEFLTRFSLLQRMKDPRDEIAWREFVECYAPLIYRWARRHRLQDADADEATGRVLLRLHLYLPRFQYDPKRGSFRRYIAKTLRSVVSEMIREWPHVTGCGADAPDHFLITIQQCPSAADNLLEELIDDQRFHQYRTAKQLAKKRCKAEHVWLAWSLAKEHHMKPVEVAEHLGIELSNVYACVSKVSRYIREEFEKLDQ